MSAINRIVWVCTVIWGASIFWIAQRPPLIDLPQHAAQIALISDVLAGQTRWAEIFTINFVTPYLTTYALGWLLSFVILPVTAVKIILTGAFVGFVLMVVALRKTFGSDPRLDWLALSGFFGFAWKWGFMSFLVAAPIGLLLIWLLLQYLEQRKPILGLLFTTLGLLLLISHGLIFAFAWTVSVAFCGLTIYKKGNWFAVLWPMVLCTLVCILYLMIVTYIQFGLSSGTDSYGITIWTLNPINRIKELFAYSFDNQFSKQYLAITAVLLSCPLLLKNQLNFKNVLCFVPVAIALFIYCFAPAFALKTAFLYQRFALFFLPAWAFVFIAGASLKQPSVSSKLACVVLALCTWWPIYNHTVESVRFDKESADFEIILAVLEPNKRALYLSIDNYSPADGHQNIYLHYGSWYQADKKGYVDFNFAWFPPQMLRFKTDNETEIRPGFEFQPKTFDWNAHKGDRYEYFIFRSEDTLDTRDYFRGAPCAPELFVKKGVWSVYQTVTCKHASP